MELKARIANCQTSSLAALEPLGDGNYFGYKTTVGKCRYSDKVSYNKNEVYNLINTNYRVNSEEGCFDRCNEEKECTGFQYWQYDPQGKDFDNCNIWTGTGYVGNGSKSTKCFMKTDDHPSNNR